MKPPLGMLVHTHKVMPIILSVLVLIEFFSPCVLGSTSGAPLPPHFVWKPYTNSPLSSTLDSGYNVHFWTKPKLKVHEEWSHIRNDFTNKLLIWDPDKRRYTLNIMYKGHCNFVPRHCPLFLQKFSLGMSLICPLFFWKFWYHIAKIFPHYSCPLFLTMSLTMAMNFCPLHHFFTIVKA